MAPKPLAVPAAIFWPYALLGVCPHLQSDAHLAAAEARVVSHVSGDAECLARSILWISSMVVSKLDRFESAVPVEADSADDLVELTVLDCEV